VLNLTKALELIFKFKNNGDLSAILLLEDMIKEEISLQQAKDSGRVNTYKTLKRLIEQNIKENSHRPALHGVWNDKITEKQYFCTDFYEWCKTRAIELYRVMKPGGYYIIEINNPIEGLKQLDDGITPINPNNIFPKDYNDFPHKTSIDIKNIKMQLKEKEAEAKAKGENVKKYIKDNAMTEIGLSFYPSSQIIDIINVLGNDITVHYQDGEMKPCIIESDIGRALIMPLHRKKA